MHTVVLYTLPGVGRAEPLYMDMEQVFPSSESEGTQAH